MFTHASRFLLHMGQIPCPEVNLFLTKISLRNMPSQPSQFKGRLRILASGSILVLFAEVSEESHSLHFPHVFCFQYERTACIYQEIYIFRVNLNSRKDTIVSTNSTHLHILDLNVARVRRLLGEYQAYENTRALLYPRGYS
jgi:hypothetical protein